MKTTTKAASQLTINDALVRFGHVLKIQAITRRTHPLIQRETISVKHGGATVDFLPSALVPVATPELYCVIIGSAVGDSDFIPLTTLNDASAAFRAFIEGNGLGARDAGSCQIYQGNKVVARVSYNGKVWEGSTYQPNEQPIFAP